MSWIPNWTARNLTEAMLSWTVCSCSIEVGVTLLGGNVVDNTTAAERPEDSRTQYQHKEKVHRQQWWQQSTHYYSKSPSSFAISLF